MVDYVCIVCFSPYSNVHSCFYIGKMCCSHSCYVLRDLLQALVGSFSYAGYWGSRGLLVRESDT